MAWKYVIRTPLIMLQPNSTFLESNGQSQQLAINAALHKIMKFCSLCKFTVCCVSQNKGSSYQRHPEVAERL